MKRLEEFIRDNREEFDRFEPGERVWKNLEEEFSQGKVIKSKRLLWVSWTAAAAAVVLFIFLVYKYTPSNSPGQPEMASETQQPEVPAEYAEELYHFTRLIELKQKELDKIRREEPELYNTFSSDLKKLDSSYQMLKQELPGNPNEERILDAMIQNLSFQINLLNEQLNIIRKIKQTKNEPHDKVYKSV